MTAAGETSRDSTWLQHSDQVRLLLDISQAVTSTLDLDRLYRVALDRLHDLIPFTGAVIAVRTSSDKWRMVASRRPPGIGEGDIIQRLPVWERSEWRAKLSRGEAFYLDDIRGDHPLAVEYRAALPIPIEQSPMRYFRSIMEVPLVLNDDVVGEISVSHEEPGYFTDAHMELVTAIGRYLVIAIENARLYAESERRTGGLAAMLELSGAVTSTLDLQELYEVALDRLGEIIPYSGANIGLNGPDGPRLVAARRPDGYGTGIVERQAGWHDSAFMRELAAGRPVQVHDLLSDEPMAIEQRKYLAVPIERSRIAYARSMLCVPLVLRGQVLGELTVAHSRPNVYGPEHVELATSVANHIAIAIENARLYAESQERARELASLLEVSRSVGRSLDTETLARAVLDQLREVMDYGNASLVMRDGPVLRIAYANSHDDPSPRTEVIGITFDMANGGPIWETLERGEPLVVADNRDGGYWSRAYQAVVGDLYNTAFAGVRSWLGVPLRVRGQTIGFITISAAAPNQFQQRQVDLAMAFAAQVSVAFENADLVRQAQTVAAMEERQRLARELHDSVSQALYGIALGARTARTQLDRNPEAAKEPVDYVLSLAEAGLAEMRALIFELRPESLESEGLVAALEKQVAATRARYGFTIYTALGDEPVMTPLAREAFYRIAQETLHNIVKHARAREVNVSLVSGKGSVDLRIRDDGIGFDPGGEFPGHLGLESMRERAARIGATLAIESRPGAGTAISLHLDQPAGQS